MHNKKLTLGFSPCPNDTFIFNALINGKIDTEGLEFDVFIADVEELNQKALNKELDITKLSFHAFAYLVNDYSLLNAGSALGKSCGPLLISKHHIQNPEIEICDSKIAIPGKYTTANFLLSLAYPDAKNKIEMLFSDIEHAVLAQEADLGVIIHENRFTYEEKGLVKIIDLGEYWEKITGLPIPLGGIVIKKDLPKDIQLKVGRILKESVSFALNNPESAEDYVLKHAQETDKDVIRQHIELYVNEYTLDLGEKGKSAIQKMFDLAAEKNIIPEIRKHIFVEGN